MCSDISADLTLHSAEYPLFQNCPGCTSDKLQRNCAPSMCFSLLPSTIWLSWNHLNYYLTNELRHLSLWKILLHVKRRYGERVITIYYVWNWQRISLVNNSNDNNVNYEDDCGDDKALMSQCGLHSQALSQSKQHKSKWTIIENLPVPNQFMKIL